MKTVTAVSAIVETTTGEIQGLVPEGAPNARMIPLASVVGRSVVATPHYNGSMSGDQGTGAIKTWNAKVGVPFPFLAVRTCQQFDTASASAINKACVTTSGDLTWPMSAASWKAATFSGAASATIAAGASRNSPTIVRSDWISSPSGAPVVDAVLGPLYFAGARHYFDGAKPYQYFGFNSLYYNINRPGDGTYMMLNSDTVDGVTTPASFASTFTDGVNVMTIEFLTSLDSITMGVVGDSTHVGIDTSTGAASFASMAAAMLTSAVRPFMVYNCAYTGLTPANYVARGKSMLSGNRARVAIVQCGSANDAIVNQAGADLALTAFLDMLDWCRLAGIPVIGTTGFTHNAGSNAADIYRQAMIRSLKAYSSALGFPLLDTNALTAGVVPGTEWAFRPGFDAYPAMAANPNLHLNDVANAVIAPVLKQILQGLGY